MVTSFSQPNSYNLFQTMFVAKALPSSDELFGSYGYACFQQCKDVGSASPTQEAKLSRALSTVWHFLYLLELCPKNETNPSNNQSHPQNYMQWHCGLVKLHLWLNHQVKLCLPILRVIVRSCCYTEGNQQIKSGREHHPRVGTGWYC